MNGAFREFALVRIIGKKAAQPLSCFTGSALILAATYLLLPWMGASGNSQYLAVGGLWLLLTLVFEFVFGHYIAKKSWKELLHAYTPQALMEGNLWIVCLIIIFLSPWLAAKMRG
jgi:hypothetical protein